MNILEAISTALEAPQFEGSDGFIRSDSWDKNRCLRIPRYPTEPITEIQDVTDSSLSERAPLLDVGEMTATDFVVLGGNPTDDSDD